jgi:hypothetical protein
VLRSNSGGGDLPPAYRDTIAVKAPGATFFKTEAKHSETTKGPGGFFLLLTNLAYSNTAGAGGQKTVLNEIKGDAKLTPYKVNVAYSPQKSFVKLVGAHFDAFANVKATITVLTPTGDTWTANGSAYGVTKLGTGQGNAGEEARASVQAIDPTTYTNVAPGDEFELTMSPNGEWDGQFPSPRYNYVGTVTFTGSMSCGFLGDLAAWSVTEDQSGNVGVSFTSNPKLGLNDAGIAQSIKQGFSFDTSQGYGQYTYNGPPSITVDVTVPSGPLVAVEGHGVALLQDVDFTTAYGVDINAQSTNQG